MRSLVIAVVAAAFVVTAAIADGPAGKPVTSPGGVVPAGAVCTTGTDGKAICPPSLPTSDAANVSYAAVIETSTAAGYTFSSASQGAARGWFSNCPANTTQLVTLTLVSGGTEPVTLYDGHYGPVAERVAGYSGNTAGCTIGLES